MLLNQTFLLAQVRHVAPKPEYKKWWSHFQRPFPGWAIDHFKELVHDGKFIPDNMFHMEYMVCLHSHYLNPIRRSYARVKLS